MQSTFLALLQTIIDLQSLEIIKCLIINSYFAAASNQRQKKVLFSFFSLSDKSFIDENNKNILRPYTSKYLRYSRALCVSLPVISILSCFDLYLDFWFKLRRRQQVSSSLLKSFSTSTMKLLLFLMKKRFVIKRYESNRMNLRLFSTFCFNAFKLESSATLQNTRQKKRIPNKL